MSTNYNAHNTATIDSGCSGHYIQAETPVVEKDYTTPYITTRTLNGATITSACSALLISDNIPHNI